MIQEVSAFLKNTKDRISESGLHNVYHIETFDIDGKKTDDAFGLNLMTNTGISWYTQSTHFGDYCVQLGTDGTNTPARTDTALGNLVFTSTQNSAVYENPSTMYNSTAGMIIGIAKVLVATVDYNVSGITSNVDVYEIGINFSQNGSTPTNLLSRSFIYDSLGQQTHITKEIDQKMVITVYFMTGIPESLVNSMYTNGKYLIGGPYNMISIWGGLWQNYQNVLHYVDNFKLIHNFVPMGVRSISDGNYISSKYFPGSFAADPDQNGDIACAIPYDSSTSDRFTITGKYDTMTKTLYETGSTNGLTDIDYDSPNANNFMNGIVELNHSIKVLETESLPSTGSPETVSAYDIFTDTYKTNSIANSFGENYYIDGKRININVNGRNIWDHKGVFPLRDFDMSSSYMYNHNTKAWDIQDSITNAASARYLADFTFVTSLYVERDPEAYGDRVQIYVYINTRNDIPITSLNMTTVRPLYATDKWWDFTTYIQISDPTNITGAAQTKKYYITTGGHGGYMAATRNQTVHQITCSEGTLYTPSDASTYTITLHPSTTDSMSNVRPNSEGVESANDKYLTLDTAVSVEMWKYTSLNVSITTTSQKACKFSITGYSSNGTYVSSTDMNGNDASSSTGTDYEITHALYPAKQIKIFIKYTDGSTISSSDVTEIKITLSDNKNRWYARNVGNVLRSNTNGWIALADRFIYPSIPYGTVDTYMFTASDPSNEFVPDTVGQIRYATDDRLIVCNLAHYKSILCADYYNNWMTTHYYGNALRVFKPTSTHEQPVSVDVILGFTDYDDDTTAGNALGYFLNRAKLWSWSQVSSNEAYLACNNTWSDSKSYGETIVLQVYNEDGNGIPQQIKITDAVYTQLIPGTKYLIGIIPNSSPVTFVVYDVTDGSLYDTFEFPTGYTYEENCFSVGPSCAYINGYVGDNYTTFLYDVQTKQVTNTSTYNWGFCINNRTQQTSSITYDDRLVVFNNDGNNVSQQPIKRSDIFVSGIFMCSPWYGHATWGPNAKGEASICTTNNKYGFKTIFKGDEVRVPGVSANAGPSQLGFWNGDIVDSADGKHTLLVSSRIWISGTDGIYRPCVIDLGATIDGTYQWAYWPYYGRFDEDANMLGLTEFNNDIIIYYKDGSVKYYSLGRFLPHKVTGTTFTITAYNNPKNIGSKTMTLTLKAYDV